MTLTSAPFVPFIIRPTRHMLEKMREETVQSNDGRDKVFLRLQKHYALVEQNPDRSVDLATPLWLDIRGRLHGKVPTLFRDENALSFVMDRIANYTYSRLIVRGVQVLRNAEAGGESDDDTAREFDRFVGELLDLSREERTSIVLRLITICRRIHADGHSLTAGQKKSIGKFANAEGHRCYLCGVDLDYSGSGLT